MTIVERLLVFMRKSGLNQSSLSKNIGVSQSTIATLIKRNRGFNTEILEALTVAEPNLNINWLLTGNGEMLIDENKRLEGKMIHYIESHRVKEYIQRFTIPEYFSTCLAIVLPNLASGSNDNLFFAFDVIDDRLSYGIEPALRINDIAVAEVTTYLNSSFFQALVSNPIIVVVLSEKHGQLIRKVIDFNDDEIILSPTHPIYIHNKKEHIRVKRKDIRLIGIVKKIIVNDPVFVIDNSIDDDKYFLANSTPL